MEVKPLTFTGTHHFVVAAKSLQSCPTLCDPIDGCPPGSWDSPGKNTGVGCHFLLQSFYLEHVKEVSIKLVLLVN